MPVVRSVLNGIPLDVAPTRDVSDGRLSRYRLTHLLCAHRRIWGAILCAERRERVCEPKQEEYGQSAASGR